MARHEAAHDPVRLAVGRIHGERPADLRLVVVLPAVEIREAGQQRVRFGAGGIDGERLVDGGLRLGRAAAIEREVREEETGVDVGGIQPERRFGERLRRRRVIVGQRTGQTGRGRLPLPVLLQRRPERVGGILGIVLLEEQAAPRRVDRRIARRGIRRHAEGGIGLLEAAEPLIGLRQPRRVLRRARLGRPGGQRRHQPLERRPRGIVAAAQLLQPRQGERGVARRLACRERRQQSIRLVVLAAHDGGARLEQDDARIAGIEMGEQTIDVGEPAFTERPQRRLQPGRRDVATGVSLGGRRRRRARRRHGSGQPGEYSRHCDGQAEPPCTSPIGSQASPAHHVHV